MNDEPTTIHIDGAARGNPGPAAYAVVIQTPGQATLEESEPLGTATNNVAEYTALVRALEIASERGLRDLQIFSDSELLVKQMSGIYRVKNADLQELHQQATQLKRNFRKVQISHVRREQNKRADFLCNEALDGHPRTLGEATVELRALPISPGKAPGKAVSDGRVREEALACLTAAAMAWSRDGFAKLPVTQVWEQIWSIMEENGVLAKKKS